MKEKSTIALVDDERNILTSLGMALEAEGYKVRTYSDGAAALEALTEEPVDLAILDTKMPRMDGLELLRRLRQQTDMPVIFLTSKEGRSTSCSASSWAPTTISPSRSRSASWWSASRWCCGVSGPRIPQTPPPKRRAVWSGASCGSIRSATPAVGTTIP